MKGWEVSPEAKSDLQDIWTYIALDNPDAADALEEEIYDACERLAANPRLGHKRKDLTDEMVLFWPVRGRYLIVYHHQRQPICIVRIFHGARDVREQL